MRKLNTTLPILLLTALIIATLSVNADNTFAQNQLNLPPITGNTIIVTTEKDEYNQGTACSLREAVTAANTNAPFGGCPAGSLKGVDLIKLSNATYTLSILGSGDDTNATGDLDILQAVMIDGVGSSSSIIDGNNTDRVIDVHQSVHLVLFDLRITNGKAPDGTPGKNGGGIQVLGSLWAENVDIYNNQAGNGNNPSWGGGHGGGIHSIGALNIINSSVRNNDAGVGGSLSSTGTAGNGGHGGGIFADGITSIENSEILYNHAGNSGNGILLQQAYAGIAGTGGGIYSSSNVTIIRSEIRSNFGGNVGAGPGGLGGHGGGIYNASSGGTLSVYTSTLSWNRAGNGKTNLQIPPGYGSGIYNASGATAIIGDSGIHDNRAAITGFRPKGAGIYNAGTLTTINTTIAKNEEPYEGGGIYNTNTGILIINSSTIAYNISQYGGGIYNNIQGSVTLRNSIVAWNTGWQGGYDCEGIVNSAGYNIIKDLFDHKVSPAQKCTITGDLTGVQIDVNPFISWSNELDYYGGETKTLIPETNSPAIDAANQAVPGSGGNACPAEDQRGVSRPQATYCDLGAAEATAQLSVSKSVSDMYTAPGQLITYTINVHNIGGLADTGITVYDDLPSGLVFAGPVTIIPPHSEATVASIAADLPNLVTNLTLTSGDYVNVFLPVTLDPLYPGGEIITNLARAFSSVPQSEGSAQRNIISGWRVMLPIILR